MPALFTFFCVIGIAGVVLALALHGYIAVAQPHAVSDITGGVNGVGALQIQI